MPIEFQCVQCGQTLRVPDEAAGKQAKCPKCESVVPVPAASSQPPTDAPGPAGPPHSGPPHSGPPHSGAGDPTGNPFGETASAGANPFGGAAPHGGEANPYSPPKPVAEKPASSVVSETIVPTAVEAGDVINFAWEFWKANLGLLVGVFLFVAGVGWMIGLVQNGIEFAMVQADFDQEVAALATVPIGLIGNLVQIYLGIGQALIFLRLARGQRAEFSDVFSGGPLFLPVLGGSILFGLAMAAGFLLLIIPGIIVAVLFWPFYYLIVERKAGVIESFSVAYEICKPNIGTTLLLFMASVGIVILGLLACIVGLLLAVPLSTAIWVTAYLMASGQLSSRASYGSRQFA